MAWPPPSPWGRPWCGEWTAPLGRCGARCGAGDRRWSSDAADIKREERKRELSPSAFFYLRIPLIVNADSGIVNSDSADRDHAVGAKRR